VAGVAEQFNHHPDIDIRFKKVRVAFWTHKKDATTRADVLLAAEVDRVA
jgi:4a-hydroxytetrahydrobiopterin dehydratase